MVEELDVGMCPVCVGNADFLISFKYGQDKQMSTGQLILTLGDKEGEVKGKKEIMFPTDYHTWV